jgi:hypothetical protein
MPKPIQEPCNHFACDAPKLDLDQQTPTDTVLTCAKAHENVVAKCPVGFCPSGRVLVSRSAAPGLIVYHKRCGQNLEVVQMNPVKLIVQP